jgi:hypothetical protein
MAKQITPLPRYIFFRGEDKTNLLLVDTLLFTVEGSLPQGCWFTSTFSKTKRPDPIGKDEKTVLPIYFIPVPFDVLCEFIHGMKFPPLLLDMGKHVPSSLKMSYKTWRTYLEYYGLLVEPEITQEPPKKKQKTWHDYADSPRFVYFKRVVEALAVKVKAEHPDYPSLLAGQKSSITCTFVNTYRQNEQDGVRTFLLNVPGEPVIKPVNIAYDIGFSLPRLPRENEPSQPSYEYIEECLDECFKPFVCYLRMDKDRRSKAKNRIAIDKWPTGRASLTPGDHDVFSIVIAAKKGE